MQHGWTAVQVDVERQDRTSSAYYKYQVEIGYIMARAQSHTKGSPSQMGLVNASLTDLPDDLKYKLVEILELSTIRRLCLVHSSWIQACRAQIFKRLECTYRNNDSLGNLAVKLAPYVGPYIRRIGITVPARPPKELEPGQLSRWLMERERYLAIMVSRATG